MTRRERISEWGVDHSTRRLGRHIVHDPRSRQYALDTSDVVLRSARHTSHIDVLDQGNLGSCTGNAMVGALGTSPCWEPLAAKANPPTLNEALAVSLYGSATRIDEWPGSYPPEDTGSSGLAVCKAAKAMGLISEYRWTFSVDDALLALVNGPVLAGIAWQDTFDRPGPTGELVMDWSSTTRGGHEVVLDEIDVDLERVWLRNSWGPLWGIEGRAWMSWGTFERLLDDSGDVAVPIPVQVARPTPVVLPWWTVLVAWLRDKLCL